MEKMKLTHNEYKLFLEKNADRVWKDEKYGMEDFERDSENVDIIPFDLAKFNLPSEIEDMINIVFDEEKTSKAGNYMLTGFSNSAEYWYYLTDKLNLKRTMGYYYSGYCTNDELHFYMSYAEGDLYLHLFENEEDYKKALADTIEWYEKNN